MAKRRKSYRKKGRCCILHESGECQYAGESTEIDHVKTRGSGGTDSPWNKMPLCFYHHTLKGQKGISWMAEKFTAYKDWLESNWWYFCGTRKKWVNPRKA